MNVVKHWPMAIALLTLACPWAAAQTPGVTVIKQPANLAKRTFDPAKPPADMPPPTPGEDAECDSDFLSDANVGGLARQTDATHATVKISQIKVTLQLNMTIWTPIKVTQHVIEHEDGHRQISDYYYQTADNLAQRIAASYMGKQVVISGTDLRGELSKLLQKMGADITDEYNKELHVEQTQLRYDAITNHSRNEVVATAAVAQSLKEIPPANGLH
jgi:hypothetical protein